MRLRLTVKGKVDVPWDEFYEVDTTEPAKWAKELVAQFNATRRPGEAERKLLALGIVRSAPEGARAHDWEKSCLVTQCKGGLLFDTMHCKHCGITGRRYGLGGSVTIDRKYDKPVYRDCNTAFKKLHK
jgi:hypothetical protein